MSTLLESLKRGPLLCDGGMGSYLFERTGRLSEMNHVYEALSVTNPDLIRQVHMTYLQTGARCLTTNTFGANADALGALGEGDRVDEINRAAVNVAREAIAKFRDQTGDEGPYFILASIGPPLTDKRSGEHTAEIYRDQIAALIEEGADALLLETFSSLSQAKAVVEVIKRFGSPPPVILQMVVSDSADGDTVDWKPSDLVKIAEDLDVPIIGVNCCAPWEASDFLDEAAQLEPVKSGQVLLSMMPNAGGLRRIGQRLMNHVNPEYMGKLARTFSEKGVSLLGGCCEVHPGHIAEMRNYLQGLQAGAGEVAIADAVEPVLETTGDETKKENGRLSRKIKENRFAVSVEILPPRGTGSRIFQSKIDFIKELADSGLADAVDVTDGSRGVPLMPPGDFISIVRNQLGWDGGAHDPLELIPHFTTRDLNTMGLQSRLIGYHFSRIYNVLYITGDPPKMSPTYPRSTAVFDMDSVDMIRYTHRFLNAGLDFGGQPLARSRDPRTRFTVGTGFEPEALDMDRELDKLRKKIDNGADYIFTQPAFRFEPLDVLERFRETVPIVVGVMVLRNLEHARRVGQVPGVVIPDSIFNRLAAYEQVEDQAKVGQEIAIEQIQWVREGAWNGLYLMSPAGHAPVLDVLRGALA